MSEPEDQHQIVLPEGVTAGGSYPILVAFHGQPKRDDAPRAYAFPRVVADVVVDLVRRGEVEPLVLVLPVFRYRGVNWPSFDPSAFRRRVEEVLRDERIEPRALFFVGHSGAVGCGGEGLNVVHRAGPAAVGFFDTCLGAGWRRELRALAKARVPTLDVHSVETAGLVPRRSGEYLSTFDFGPVFQTAGLAPAPCPERLPEVPLREQPSRCAADPDGTVRALVIDTGEGQAAHDAAVPVALAYFLRQYLASGPKARPH
jgi:hypothetical protein